MNRLHVDSVDLSNLSKRRVVLLTDEDSEIKKLFQGLKCLLRVHESKDVILESKKVDDTERGGGGCSLCLCSTFESLEDQRRHYQLDWHRYNVKAFTVGRHILKEDEFNKLICSDDDNNKRINDEIGSISGSEDEECLESEITGISNRLKIIGTGSSRQIYFENEEGLIFSIHKVLLIEEHQQIEVESLTLRVQSLAQRLCWSIFMMGGGHFAAVIYQGKEIIVHKSIHTYTVRAKQGGGQTAADNRSGGNSGHKSAGSALRRHNETSFRQRIWEIMKQWQPLIDQSQLIFYRSPGSNRSILFGPQSYLDKKDVRLRSIPFPTRRATFNEVKRVRKTLLSISIYQPLPPVVDQKVELPEALPQVFVNKSSSESSLSDVTLECVTETVSTDHLIEYENVPIRGKPRRRRRNVKLSKCPNISTEVTAAFIAVCSNSPQAESIGCFIDSLVDVSHEDIANLVNIHFGHDRTSALHVAARLGHHELITKLLSLGADPSSAHMDSKKMVAYQVCKNKSARQCFRSFRENFPDRYVYESSLIPPPLDDEAKAKKEQSLAAKRLHKQSKLKETKDRMKAEKHEASERQRFLLLSDREKRALAADRRYISASSSGDTTILARCYVCACDISGKIPFEFETYRFCSMSCLKIQRINIKS